MINRAGNFGDDDNSRTGKKISNHTRKKQNRKGKNNGNDTSIIHPHGKISGDTAIDFIAADPPGIVDRNIALSFRYVNNSHNHQKSNTYKSNISKKFIWRVGKQGLLNISWKARSNAGKN